MVLLPCFNVVLSYKINKSDNERDLSYSHPSTSLFHLQHSFCVVRNWCLPKCYKLAMHKVSNPEIRGLSLDKAYGIRIVT